MDRSSVPVVVMLLVVPVLAMDLFGDLFAKRTLRTLPRGFVAPCARRATSRMFVASSPSKYQRLLHRHVEPLNVSSTICEGESQGPERKLRPPVHHASRTSRRSRPPPRALLPRAHQSIESRVGDHTHRSPAGGDVDVVAPVPVPTAGVGVRGGDVGGVARVHGQRGPRRAPRQPHGLLQVLARRGGGGCRREHQEPGRRRRQRGHALEKPGRDAAGLRPGAPRRRRLLRRAGRRRRRARPAPQRRARRPLPQAGSRGAVRAPVQREHAAGHDGRHLQQLPAEHGNHDLRAAPQPRPARPRRGPAAPRRARLRRRPRRQLLPPLPPLKAESRRRQRRRRRRQGVQDPQGRPVRARHLPALPLRDPRLLRVRHDRADAVRARRGHRNRGLPRRPELRHQEVVPVQVPGVPGEDQSVAAVRVVVIS